MRADKFFAERFGSRAKAKDALARGLVLQNGKPLSPSDEAEEGREYVFLAEDGFVSLGGKKLERGLSVFGVSVENRVIADLGASTGGFTDCLLRRGAKRVYCVDVGESQLSPALSSDARVVVMDNTNARYLTRESFPEPIDDVTADLSFISLRLILPAVRGLLGKSGRAFLLFKPQFECGGRGLGKSGILPVSRHAELLSEFYTECVAGGLFPQGIVNAPLSPKKNVEYMIFLTCEGGAISRKEFLTHSENFL